MDAFAPPSIRAETSGRERFRIAEAAALTLALALSLVGVPGAPNARLDASWQEMLIHAHAQGMQFGRDLIFTWGPWGFLCNGYHLGSLGAVPILVWQTAGQLGVALALVCLTQSLPRWRRLAFAACILAFHWLFLDTVYFVLIALIGIAGLMKRETSLARLVAWTLVLGFLAQLKFTYLVIASAAVLAAMACWLGRGSWVRALGIPCGYATASVAAWIAAGQSPGNLYPYLRRSLEIASGYGDAMGLDESWVPFIWGSALALVCAVFVWRVWRTVPERPFALSASGLLAFSLFVMWKESFTRADLVPLGGHVFGLFTCVGILAPALPGLLFPGKRWHWFDGSLLLCLLGIACFDPEYYEQAPRVAWERIYGNVRALSRLSVLPREWQRSREEACALESRPAIRAAVGQGTADVYDFNTGIALLNGLRLAARPVFQGYSAYTPALEGLNLRFYQSDRSPEFLIWNDERVDNRYPGQDDALLVAGLPGHYEPLFPEGGCWLFRRRTPLAGDQPERRLLFSRRVRLSEEIALPAGRGEALWLRADAVPNNLGRLRALAYKGALINLATTDDLGLQSVWRLVPRVAREGFILVPTLASGNDVASLMRGEARSWVRSFHFEAPAGQEEFWSHVDVGVFGMPGLPLRAAPPIPWLVELGILDRPAIFVTSVAPQEVIETPEGRALLLHAEGEIVLGVPSGARNLSFGYGLREGAYSGDGHTAGVAFDVDAVWTSGRREHLWGRFLDPVARQGDRGTQHLDLALPADPPARLILHTGPGLKNDNRWDWSYVSALRFDAPGGK